ncbi:BTB domain-containing protein [Cephalotus follicularis]|uniref:BTB domain-containing protein n=1 Tax=Cephalotus follicularis TaxID=3775 RepID=A0A1Q3C3U8_CEPFO|nr:BTB domain-containing protein [Cephalotus follicularis]
MKSSKHEKGNNYIGHINTLHTRLYHALNLGTRYYDKKEWKWQCTDIEIQRHVVRSIAAFLDCVYGDTLHHSLVKDSVSDVIKALVWILQDKNGAIVSIAANVVVKLISLIPRSILHSHVLDLVHPLSSLLSSHQLEVETSCANSLNMILSIMSVKKEKEVWEILKETDTVVHIARNIQHFSGGGVSIEYFLEMAFLLCTILEHWPPSRYSVWKDAAILEFLETVRAKPNFSGQAAVLKIYSTLALCGNGAKKLLENGEALLQYMVYSMGISNSISVRIEAFRLAQVLATDEYGFSKMMSFCQPLVEAIISGMSGWSLHSGKLPGDSMSLLGEACRLALITRWEGEHHIYFWKKGIDRILLDLLVENFHKKQSQHLLSLEEQISIAREGLNANYLHALRPYIWDILGCLATHCGEDFDPSIHGNEMHISILITSACLVIVDSIHRGRKICQNDSIDSFKGISASRAFLMMIFSPSKYISSKARILLYEILQPNGKEYLKHLLHALLHASSGSTVGQPHMCQTMINVMSLTCYSGLPEYQMHIIKSEGLKILLAFLRWCLRSDVYVEGFSFAARFNDMCSKKTCCWVFSEEWEGRDSLLLYGLWGLAELVRSGSLKVNLDNFAGKMNCAEADLVSIIQEIYSNTSTPGPRWHAAYILSYFGFFGFPTKLEHKIGKALNEKNYADIQFILSNGESLSVHAVVLSVRCPLLLPPEECLLHQKTSYGSSVRDDITKQKEIHLSAHVDHQALAKLLEFVYLGHLQAGVEVVKKLKVLAKHCKLQSLSRMLCRKRPKWGTPLPSFDLAGALSCSGQRFSDVMLEANAAAKMHWTCGVCSLSVPHMHVHKVVLWSTCDYMRALFESGMQESHSQTIKVPVSWEAMMKLVDWFYTGDLPNPPSGCLWDNMNAEEMLFHLKPYIELSWLAEYWFLNEFHDACYRVIISYLDSARQLSIHIIQIAAHFCQWKLAEVAANHMAPSFRQLQDSGALEVLDELLVDMVRAASVRLSQEGN